MPFTTDPATGQQVLNGTVMPAADRTGILTLLADLETRVTDLEETEYAIDNFAELQAAAALSVPTRVHLYADITCTAAITLPMTMEIFYRGNVLIDGGYSVIHHANVGDMTREPKFSGFTAGDVYGSFGTGVVYPEWWGPLVDDHHDVAINCAIQANANAASNLGIEVSLADRQYDISLPLDLSGTKSILTGAGDGRTSIWMTSAWSAASFVTSSLWSGTLNHAAAVWIGNSTSGTQTFRTGVRGVTINCYYAAVAHPTKRISGVSSKGWVEENSFVRDVSVTLFTGVGIGFPVHTDYVSSAVINGLSIRDIWITQGMKRDSYPMLFTHNNVRTSVADVTIDCSLARANSAGAIVPPAFVMDWPRYGIVAKGTHLDIRNIHIEGTQIGVYIEQSDGVSNVTVDNLDVNHLMRGDMVYYTESVAGYTTAVMPPPTLASQIIAYPADANRTRPFLSQYSAAVMVSTTPIVNPIDGLNTKDSCNLRNIVAIGQCDYLVRDCVYGTHSSAFGQGQFPATATGCVKSYVRNNSYPLPTNSGSTNPPTWVAGGAYFGTPLESPSAIPSDKTYVSSIV